MLTIGIVASIGAIIGIILGICSDYSDRPVLRTRWRWLPISWWHFTRWWLVKIAVTLVRCLLFGSVGIILGGILGFPTAYAMQLFVDPIPRHEECHAVPIYSLKDNRDIEGTFVLGSGSINTEPYYYAMIERDGGFVMWRCPAEGLIVRETNERRPALRRYYSVPDERKFWDRWVIYKCKEAEVGRYLDVPPGTIVRDYSIDLK